MIDNIQCSWGRSLCGPIHPLGIPPPIQVTCQYVLQVLNNCYLDVCVCVCPLFGNGFGSLLLWLSFFFSVSIWFISKKVQLTQQMCKQLKLTGLFISPFSENELKWFECDSGCGCPMDGNWFGSCDNSIVLWENRVDKSAGVGGPTCDGMQEGMHGNLVIDTNTYTSNGQESFRNHSDCKSKTLSHHTNHN